MPLTTKYQDFIVQSLRKYDFQRILRMKGKCHDSLIGELINWWFSLEINGLICNPARCSKSRSRRYFADLLFLEQFKGSNYYEVKGVAEIENNEEQIMDKIKSLASYETYVRRGSKAYPNLEFAILCYRLNVPNDELAENIYNDILKVSGDSRLLWIVCEIAKSLKNRGEDIGYKIYMPNYVRGYDFFYYSRNFSSVILYGIKNGKQVGDITASGSK